MELFGQGEPKALVKRITLSSFCDQLGEMKEVVRTHRAYAVNIGFLKHTSGNAQGYQLTMEGVEFTVPVSRKYMPEFDEAVS